MDDPENRRRQINQLLDELRDSDTQSLTSRDASVEFDVARNWNIPESDKIASESWGLPKNIKPDYFFNKPQIEHHPQVSFQSKNFYSIGEIADDPIVVEPDSGAVYFLASWSYKKVIFNSSLQGYIKCSWLWRSTLPLLVEMGNLTWTIEQFDSHEDEIQEIFECMQRIDPTVVDSRSSMWGEIVFDLLM
ncbi:hypothetical protein F4561_004439 [Lipingzhangella halophila]|uniref:SUKH-4 immunity protein n=1 Tax=Lipingzhangella halophila TaxID=1783352 RepID=A0A7W7RKE0_9ACTN|nr:SUKH-4 family immunity protein [Lipingzhangella halophila]MBB4933619.1 hypothetical protein [Lipingzhangella halophila]